MLNQERGFVNGRGMRGWGVCLCAVLLWNLCAIFYLAPYFSLSTFNVLLSTFFHYLPIWIRISLAVPIASSTLLTTCVARDRLVSSAAFFSRSSACARIMPS